MNEFDQMQDGVEGVELPDVDLDGPGGRGGGGGSNIVFAVIVVLVLAFQAVSSHFILRKTLFANPPNKPAKTKTAPEEFGQVFQMEGIIVNPADAKGSRHLLVDIGFQTEDPKVILELTEREVLLRDNIITFFSAQRYDVLTDISMREKIRDRVREIANYNLTAGQVDRVFFIRYVVQ